MKICALLIGINTYKDTGINPLYGCVNDINHFEQYLLDSLNVPKSNIFKLLDEEATKSEIVAAFQIHFSNAKKNDICIFYFAGHGVRQYANAVFEEDALSGKLECITCHDTKLDGTNLIADKELRWLIHQLSKKSSRCHILTIFDCCHSGDNTRSTDESLLQERFILISGKGSRGREYIMPKRVWSDFIFSEVITEQVVEQTLEAGKKLDDILPQGKHIQLAACANNETAKEGGERGFFSKHLLQILESSNSKITYFDLRSLIYREFSNLPPSNLQTPQFYAVNTSIFQPFLGGDVQTSIQATVKFNDQKNRWEMNMGEIYGIYEKAEIFVELPHQNNEVGIVTEVFHDCCVLRFDIETEPKELEKPDNEKRIRRTDYYKADVGLFMQKEIKVACVDPSLMVSWVNFCKKSPILIELAKVKPVMNIIEADYVLHTKGGHIFIARPDALTRPLVKMIDDTGKETAFEKIIEQLKAISRWEFVRAQKSADKSASLFDNLDINFIYADKTENLDNRDKVRCPVTKYIAHPTLDLKAMEEALSIQIVNNHPTEALYISGVWLSELFGINCTVIKQNSIAIRLEPKDTAYVFDKNFLLTFRNYILTDKWDTFSNYLKIYVAPTSFDITQLQQTDLEYPYKKTMRGDDDSLNLRGIIYLSLDEKKRMPQWAVKTIEFELDLP